jgi:hypothetical protein
MDDNYYRDRLSAYADNELPLDERQAVDEHLKQNAESRRMLEEIMRFKQFALEHGDLDDTDYFEQNARAIEQRLGLTDDAEVTDISKPRFAGLGWKIAAAAASIAVLVFIGLNSDQIRNMLASPDDRGQLSETPQPGQPTERAEQFRDQVVSDTDQATEYPAVQKDDKIDAKRQLAARDEGSRDATPGEAESAKPQAERPSANEASEEVSEAAVDHVKDRVIQGGRDELDVYRSSSPAESVRVPIQADSIPIQRAPKEKERTLATGDSNKGPVEAIQDEEAFSLHAPTATSSQALAEQKADVGTVENEQSMDVWRARRDSLLPIYLAMTGDTTVAGRHATAAAAKARLDKGEHSLPDIERDLVDCWFHIASESDNSSERKDARISLQRYSERRAAHHADMAREKLDQLNKTRRPDKR